MSSFGAEPILNSYAAVALVAIGLALLLLAVRPQFGALSRRRWWVLAGLRLGIILLITLALLRPTRITTERTPRTSVLVMLLDISRSMQLPSGRNEETRWQAERLALQKSQAALAQLAKETELRVYAYDSRLHPLQMTPGGQVPLPEKPVGEQTDIGTSLYEAIRPEQGKRLAGVVLLGDGAQTAFEPQVETQEAGRALRDSFGAPLYTVTFGPAGDAAQARDVAVERLDEQFTVFVKNELLVRALVRIRGYVKQDIPVELILEDAQGKRQTIGRKTVRAAEDGQQVAVEFSYTPQVAGHFRLTVVADQQPGELVAKNNELGAYLTVLEGGLRVLYLDGAKRFEQKFLRRALNASPDIELDDRIIDRRSQKQWPINLGSDLKNGKYDAFILGDLDAAALGTENLQALADAIAAGKGLLMIGGRNSFGPGHYLGTPLASALPIQIDRLEGADFGQERDEFFLNGPLAEVPAEAHPLTRLAADDANAAVWKKLPPLAWANRFVGVKEAPGVRVLLATPDGKPLLVSGEYGRGRVLAYAGESTYRWTMHGFEKEHKRFWRQVILWLVRREDLNKDDVWIKLDQRRFNPGSRVHVTAGARTSAGDAITSATFDTVVTLPGGKQEPLRLALDKDEWVGSFIATAPGDYAIDTAATDSTRKLGSARAEFLVFDRDVELSNPAADPDLMASLSAWTRQDGGKSIAPEELPTLLAELANRPKEYETREIKWKLASTPLDAWLFLLLLVALLSGEWWLRKKWGLV